MRLCHYHLINLNIHIDAQRTWRMFPEMANLQTFKTALFFVQLYYSVRISLHFPVLTYFILAWYFSLKNKILDTQEIFF